MKLADYSAKSARHILVYGAPKSGKTALVGQLAKRYKLWFFDLEDGVKTLLNPAILPKEYWENVELFSLPDKQTFPIAIETILKVFRGGTHIICEEHGKVSCPQCKSGATICLDKFDNAKDILIIDSFSQLVESSMNYIMRTQLSADNFDAKPGWDEYGKQGRILDRIGSMIQTAQFNIIVTSHEMMVEMEDKSKKIVPIGGTSNASKVFAKYFDDVVYCELVNKKHRCVSSTTAKINVLAGSRSGVDLGENDGLEKLFG